MTESESAVLEDMDDFLEEALGQASDVVSVGPTPPKKSRDRDVSLRLPSSVQKLIFITWQDSIFRTPAAKYMQSASNTPMPSSMVADGNVKPLVHTVSFYRKQQSQASF
jgi:hypothetical protein